MKLKDAIKKKTAIYCETDEEKIRIAREADRLGLPSGFESWEARVMRSIKSDRVGPRRRNSFNFTGRGFSGIMMHKGTGFEIINSKDIETYIGTDAIITEDENELKNKDAYSLIKKRIEFVDKYMPFDGTVDCNVKRKYMHNELLSLIKDHIF